MQKRNCGRTKKKRTVKVPSECASAHSIIHRPVCCPFAYSHVCCMYVRGIEINPLPILMTIRVLDDSCVREVVLQTNSVGRCQGKTTTAHTPPLPCPTCPTGVVMRPSFVPLRASVQECRQYRRNLGEPTRGPATWSESVETIFPSHSELARQSS